MENIYNLSHDTTIQNNLFILLLIVTFIMFNLSITYYSYKNDLLQNLLILWIIPGALSIIILSILFDYLPHRYYDNNINENKYKTTNMTHGLFSKNGKVNKVIAFLTCNQLTYHNIHHLYPKVPFYHYQKIWEDNKNKLIKLETPVQSVF